ncbi:hypothetical protein ABPG75_004752 [Micractinium tetrahymenae]
MRALVRGLAGSFASAICSGPLAEPISLELAQWQHQAYIALLRKLLPGGVVELPADDRHPDCCFIEDTAVVAGHTAIITRIGAPSRQGEEAPVAAALAELGYAVTRMTPPATLDGGDVLQLPGSTHVPVGMSKRTNAEGISQLAKALPGRAVHAVPLPHGLHLKSLVTALDAHTLLIADTPAGRALSAILASNPLLNGAIKGPRPSPRLQHVFVPDPICANVLLLGDRHVVTQGSDAATEALLDVLCAERGLQLHRLPRATEFIKADGALTCCSILLPDGA